MSKDTGENYLGNWKCYHKLEMKYKSAELAVNIKGNLYSSL